MCVMATRQFMRYEFALFLVSKGVCLERPVFPGSGDIGKKTYAHSTGLPSSVCEVDCAINGFISDQISLSFGDTFNCQVLYMKIYVPLHRCTRIYVIVYCFSFFFLLYFNFFFLMGCSLFLSFVIYVLKLIKKKYVIMNNSISNCYDMFHS